jgi:hypothetical protein
MNEYVTCFACGAKCLNVEFETHAYMLSAPGCWEMYTEVLAREYSDLLYWKAHQFTVDAYACQHVGEENDRRAINSVYIHLVSLYVLFELGQEDTLAPKLRAKAAQFIKAQTKLERLTPPESPGELTIYEVWNNDDGQQHYEIAKNWARSVWEAWGIHHGKIEEIVYRLIPDHT